MKKIELKKQINQLVKEQEYISLSELCAGFDIVFWNGGCYTPNPNAATYNTRGCNNNFLVCEDGYVPNPF